MNVASIFRGHLTVEFPLTGRLVAWFVGEERPIKTVLEFKFRVTMASDEFEICSLRFDNELAVGLRRQAAGGRARKATACHASCADFLSHLIPPPSRGCCLMQPCVVAIEMEVM